MELFSYLEQYRVLVCTECQFAIPPVQLPGHIRKHHMARLDLKTHRQAGAYAQLLRSSYDLLDPVTESIITPPADHPPLPHLRVYKGLACLYCSNYAARSPETIRQHFRRNHPNLARPKGHPSSSLPIVPRCKDVSCQRFFHCGRQCHFFQVQSTTGGAITQLQLQINEGTRQDLVRAKALAQRRDWLQTLDDHAPVIPHATSMSEVSPWLDLTRWPQYLRGLKLRDVALLTAPPYLQTEPLLRIFSEALDRLVERAHRSICEDRINTFDQTRINSFVRRPRSTDRPLFVNLQKTTFRKYTTLWKRLIAFAYRTIQPDRQPSLRHRFTNSQQVAFDRLITAGEAVRLLESTAVIGESLDADAKHGPIAKLDRTCLSFCISLLDHRLTGDIYESVVVGFMAALAIRPEKEILADPCNFSPNLSGLIKIGQMLVIEEALASVEDRLAEEPSDLIDEMTERFLLYGSRSPFEWMLRLRAYAKKVRDSITSDGFILWSDDEKTLSYKGITLAIDHIPDLVREEVRLAQSQLEELLLLHDDEKREDIIPPLSMRELRDNVSEEKRGWSFLQDKRNEKQLIGENGWLFHRVMDNDWLLEEFTGVSKSPLTGAYAMKWKPQPVRNYLTRVDAFLERLLLLMHITSGQPARGTEIVTLRVQNTILGHHRNVFIEDGLVSIVTSYHKGYAITGSTKIIHRYLPKEVSELFVYYMWLVRPFRCELEALALGREEPPSPFLWPKGDSHWKSSQLTTVIKAAFRRQLCLDVTTSTWRHIAIAISRAKLSCGGFKRDYSSEEDTIDTQAGHTSWTAGAIYARSIAEAPGHIEANRFKYRQISREWHSWLGFTIYLGARKRHAEDGDVHRVYQPSKRLRLDNK